MRPSGGMADLRDPRALFLGALPARRLTASRAGRRRSGPVERLGEVRDEVVDGLDADRQPDERLVDLELRAGDREVGHHGRQLDERLDAAERLGEGEEPGRLADRDGALPRGAAVAERRG